MNNYQAKLIKEHSELVVRIAKLQNYVYGDGIKDDKIEYANKCVQLAAMKKYEEALRARMENAGIRCDGFKYFEIVGEVKLDTDGDYPDVSKPTDDNTNE